MKLGTYSSLAAFMAHYAALSAAPRGVSGAQPQAGNEAEKLAAMERVIGELDAADREALRGEGAPAAGAAARRRARAELRLHRLLAARGLLAG